MQGSLRVMDMFIILIKDRINSIIRMSFYSSLSLCTVEKSTSLEPFHPLNARINQGKVMKPITVDSCSRSKQDGQILRS